MADTALQVIVSPFLELVLDNLISLMRREFRLLWGINKDLEKLSSILSTIRSVLKDAEVKQIKDEATRDWLRKLKDAAYDADDVLDECEFEALQLESDKSCTEQVSDSFSTCFYVNQIMFRRQMGRMIKELIKRFDDIAAERSKFHLSSGVAESSGVEGIGVYRETSSRLTEPHIYGRDGEKEDIVQLLLGNGSSQYIISIYPILGFGGLGKTTLAQLVYNDQRVVSQFDTRIWICVSEDFGTKRITKMIIDHLLEKSCDLVDLDPMQNLLKKLLQGKKFLLVLDDVWDDDVEKWNKLKYFLTCGGGSKGSAVIVTTRLPDVVSSVSLQAFRDSSITCLIHPTHNLKGLRELDCWALFKQHAFGDQIVDSPNLLEIGWEIVSKCGGVPLAVKALGGMLHSKKEEVWNLVRCSGIWSLQEDAENTVLRALRWSYNHLPPLLKQCFANCSIYPKDTIMSKEDLIHQWMANHYIQSSERREAEDVGDYVFIELLRRSFLQEMSEDGSNPTWCKMHNLMHDLAQSVTINEFSSMKIGIHWVVPPRVRHVSVICELPVCISPDSLSTLNSLSKSQPFLRTLHFERANETSAKFDLLVSSVPPFERLRTLYLAHLWTIESLPHWIGHLKHLRYLNLLNTGITSLPKYICSLTNMQILELSYNEGLRRLPKSIGNLKRLRFLGLNYTDISVLPESICKMTNLQTLGLEGCIKLEMLPESICNLTNLRSLNVRNCRKLKMLPTDMRNMRSLRHLTNDWCCFSGMPVGVGQLTRLETLKLFKVGSSLNRTECAAGIEELERLDLLRGDLLISGLSHVLDPRDAEKANLRCKKDLSELWLFWSGGFGDEDDDSISKEVLEGLKPHPNLKHLWVKGYPGLVFPSWLENSVTELQDLRSIKFEDMPNVEGFVSPPTFLRELVITKCPKLRLPDPTGMMLQSINFLGVERCNDPMLRWLEALPHLSSLRIGGFDDLESLLEAPLRKLTGLQFLSIHNCNKLKRLPMELENLTTLVSLVIRSCEELEYITEEGLRNLLSLKELKIIDCVSLKSLSLGPSSLRHLAALRKLHLVNCPDMDFSAVNFQCLVSLKELTLQNMPQLVCLPDDIQCATSLLHLYLWECKNLRILPEWLQDLPPALNHFRIWNCHPELHRRCEKNKGEDWRKISHLRVVNTEE